MKKAITPTDFLKQRIIEKVLATDDVYLLHVVDKMLGYATPSAEHPQGPGER